MKLLREIYKEATAETDAEFRQEGERFFSKLAVFVKDSQKVHSVSKVLKTGDYDGSYVIPAKEIDPKYNDLEIVLTTPKNYKAAFGPKGDENFIALTVLTKPYIISNVGSTIPRHRDSFVHEFVHYLDSKRWKGGRQDFTSYAQNVDPSTDSSEKYYNSPMEFNAYYQQAVTDLTSTVERAVKQGKLFRLKTYIPGTAQQFIKNTKKMFLSKRFVGNLNPKMQRHLDKRLADLYVSMKEKYR